MKIAKVVFVLALALTMLLASSLAVSAQGGVGGTWNTGFMIQNLGDAEASVTIEYYDSSGVEIHSDSKTIPVGGNVNVYPPGYSDTDLPAGKYSVVLSSSQPIAAVANNANTTSKIGDSYLGSESGTQTAYAPLVYKNYSSWTSIIYVQNASSSSQDITVYLYPVGQSAAAVQETYTVAGYATVEIDLASTDFDAFGSSTYGSATISGASGDIAVMVAANRQPDTDTASLIHMEYRGLSGAVAGTSFFAPLVYKALNNWNSGVMVQNTESAATTVAITYTASPDSSAAGTVVSGSIDLGANAGGVFYLPSESGLPDGFYGGVELSSSSTNILAIVVNANYSGSAVGSCYEAFNPSAAASSIAAPLIFRAFADSETGIQVQNVGTGTSTDISLTVAKAAGTSPVGGDGPWTYTATGVGRGEVATFYLPSLMSTVSLLYGSATVTSTGSVPIVAVVNSPAYARGVSANYAGINY